MNRLLRGLTIAILAYLLIGGWWVIGMIRDERLLPTVLGWIYAILPVFAVLAVIGAFRNWPVKWTRLLALIAVGPAAFYIVARGAVLIGYPVPLRIPIIISLDFLSSLYGAGVDAVPGILFALTYYLIRPTSRPTT